MKLLITRQYLCAMSWQDCAYISIFIGEFCHPTVSVVRQLPSPKGAGLKRQECTEVNSIIILTDTNETHVYKFKIGRKNNFLFYFQERRQWSYSTWKIFRSKFFSDFYILKWIEKMQDGGFLIVTNIWESFQNLYLKSSLLLNGMYMNFSLQ